MSEKSFEEFYQEIRLIEQKWQKKWDEDDIFKGVVDSAKPKFFFTSPYPYATGPLHVGHARTYTTADLYCRFKRQQGLNTLWPMGFHITGTPVLAISAKIASNDEKTIKLFTEYVGLYIDDQEEVKNIVASFSEPLSVASFFAKHIIQDFKLMGYSLDTNRQFTTGDPDYNKFIEWQYKQLIDKDLIIKGEYPILWCTSCQNAVGEDDIKDADVDKVEVNEFVGLKFALGEEFLVAATLRPETIYGATNIWLNPETTYNRIKIDGETWIVSEQAAEKINHQNHSIEIINSFKGAELIGEEAFAPRIDRPLPILPASFVDADHATGVVYSVPAHAPYDYIALRDLQEDLSPLDNYPGLAERVQAMKPIALISIESFGEFPAIEVCDRLGVKNQNDKEKLEKATQEIYAVEFYNGIMMDFTDEFAGLKVEEAKTVVAEVLRSEGRVSTTYETSRKAYCRCGNKIIVGVLSDQYFLHYGNKEWKTNASKALDQMIIEPVKFRTMFEKTFDWLDRRPCVRKRGLGTEFPLTKGEGWIIESLSDSVIYMALYTIIGHIRDNNITDKQLIPEVFDYVFLNKGESSVVSEKTGIAVELLDEMAAEFSYWYPNDLRHTAIAHISNHLSFAIFHHVAIFPEKYWIKGFTMNELLIMEGVKMSKSKGNVIPIAEVPKYSTVDITRLYQISSASADTVMDWTDEGLKKLAYRVRKFWNIANSIINEPNENFDLEKASFMTKAFISAAEKNLKAAIDKLSEFEGREYTFHAFYEMLSLVEFYQKSSIGITKEEKYTALKRIIDSWIVTLSPVIPHICEELNEKMGETIYCSLRNLPIIELQANSETLSRQTVFISHLIDDIQEIIDLKRAPAKKVVLYVAPEWKQKLFPAIKEIIGEGAFNLGKIMGQIKSVPEFAPKMGIIAKEMKSIKGDARVFRQNFLTSQSEVEAIEGYRSYLEKVLNCEIEIYLAESEEVNDPMNRASRAQPMKPAIYIEFDL
ncbi:MAG: leucine--tRNA ligase [Candidatus Kariarchaeaceae archaeon]